MVKLITLSSFQDQRGTLIAIEKEIPFLIKRVFFIYNTNELPRGGHSHKETRQALICIQGSCSVAINTANDKQSFLLNSPQQALIIEPQEWHELCFSKPSILLVLASTSYTANDYVYNCL